LNRTGHVAWLGSLRTRIVEMKGIVAVTPDECFQEAAYRKFKLRIAYLDIGIDNGLGGPLACHGVLEALDAKFGAKDTAETNVSIASIIGGVDIRIVSRTKDGVGGIVLSEGMEGNGIAELIGYSTSHTVLRGKVVLPGHPVFIGHHGSRELKTSHLLAKGYLA
jgi:hypothetical protein